MDFWLLYLITRTGQIHELCAIMGILGMIISLIGYALAVFGKTQQGKYDEETRQFGTQLLPYTTKGIKVCLIPLLLSFALPSTNDWKLIVGGYYVTNIQGIEQLPPDIVLAAHKFLKEYGDTEKEKPKNDDKK